MRPEDLLRARLVEAERERERVTARVRNAVELADCRYVGLAVRAAKALGDVEDNVGAFAAKALREIVRRLEVDHFADRRESACDGGDGGRRVPLGILVVDGCGRDEGGDRDAATGRLLFGARQLGRLVGSNGLRLLIVRETDARHPIPELEYSDCVAAPLSANRLVSPGVALNEHARGQNTRHV